MKKCQKCGNKNAIEMSFCLECGTALTNLHKEKVLQDNINTQNLKTSEQITASFENDGNTIQNTHRTFQQSVPTYTRDSSPKSNKGIIFGIGASLIALLFMAVGVIGIIAYISVDDPKPKPLVTTPTKKPDIPAETPTFPESPNPTKSGTYRLKQGTGWQLSNIITVGSENFRVVVKGKINLDGISRNISAKGVEGYKNRRIHSEFRTGALLMRTHYPDGKHSNIQAVTDNEYWQNYPDERGKLEFIVNDNSPDYNDGGFIITVTMVNVPNGSK